MWKRLRHASLTMLHMAEMNRRQVLRILSSTAPALWASKFAALRAQGAPIQLQTLAPKLTLLTGAGGNIAILQADDGLFMIDSGVPETAEAVDTKARSVAAVPLKLLFNTHFHYDHVG